MQCKTRLDFVSPLIILLIITAASLVPRPSYAQRIEGRVIDVETKKPLAFANIVLVGSSKGTMSLDDGRFTLRRVPAGTYTVKVLMMGYKAVQRRKVVVKPDAVVNLVFELHTTIVAEMQRIDVFAKRPDGLKPSNTGPEDVIAAMSSGSKLTPKQTRRVVDAIALKTGIVKVGDELHL